MVTSQIYYFRCVKERDGKGKVVRSVARSQRQREWVKAENKATIRHRGSLVLTTGRGTRPPDKRLQSSHCLETFHTHPSWLRPSTCPTTSGSPSWRYVMQCNFAAPKHSCDILSGNVFYTREAQNNLLLVFPSNKLDVKTDSFLCVANWRVQSLSIIRSLYLQIILEINRNILVVINYNIPLFCIHWRTVLFSKKKSCGI